VLKGFRDQLPERMIRRLRVIATFREIFERHGFEPIDTPALEHLGLLTGKAGENEKLMYRFVDNGGRDVGLRYDLTVPLARFAAANENDLVFPFKRYHIAPVWRAENPQRGRFREFWQCDADIVGAGGPAADAEIIAILAEALGSLGLHNFEILVSHRRLLEGIAETAGVPPELAGSMFRSVDKLVKIGPHGVQAEMVDAGVHAEVASRVLDAVTAKGEPGELLCGLRDRLEGSPPALEAVGELESLFSLLPALGVPAESVRLDVSIARGLDYYTGTVYEATVTEPKVGSLAGGGRYDDLVGSLLGRPIPATGGSLGLERILEVIDEFGLLPAQRSVSDVFVAVFAGGQSAAASIATALRRAGLNADLSLLAGKGLGDQLRYAARKGVPYVVIPGEDEMARGQVTLKHLASGEQSLVELAALPGMLRASLRR
jgi:histidyl-tRNA synthetase